MGTKKINFFKNCRIDTTKNPNPSFHHVRCVVSILAADDTKGRLLIRFTVVKNFHHPCYLQIALDYDAVFVILGELQLNFHTIVKKCWRKIDNLWLTLSKSAFVTVL